MCEQDGFLPICPAHGVKTLQEQKETWAVLEGQGKQAAHAETGEGLEHVILMAQNEAFWVPGEISLADHETAINHWL